MASCLSGPGAMQPACPALLAVAHNGLAVLLARMSSWSIGAILEVALERSDEHLERCAQPSDNTRSRVCDSNGDPGAYEKPLRGAGDDRIRTQACLTSVAHASL
jgi:hypothetical protein